MEKLSLPVAKDSRMEHENPLQENSNVRKVIYGTNSPKITGKSQYKYLKHYHYHGPKDPASASATYFGLSLIQ